MREGVQAHKQVNFLIIQNSTFLYPMPFLNAMPATDGSGMLGNKNRVSFHGSLFTIISRILESYSGFNEINSVLPDCIDSFILDILPVFAGKFEFRSEFGFF